MEHNTGEACDYNTMSCIQAKFKYKSECQNLMNVYSDVRSGFDEKGSDGSYLSKQQTCTSRKDENDIVERFFSCEELLYT